MDDSSGSARAAPDLDALARDWITLWQSELAAIATDREAQETWYAILALWAGAAGAMLAAMPPARPNDYADRRAGPAATPGASPPAAAPDPRDGAIERLTRHIAELESRLAELERDLPRGSSSHLRGAGGSAERRRRR